MKSFLRTFLIAALPFGVFMGMYHVLEDGWSGLYFGAVSGVLFGLLMATVTRFAEDRALHSPPVLSGEIVLREERATYSSGKRAVAGRLYLTEGRLFFEGFEKGSRYDVSIPIHDIVDAEVVKIWGVFPSRLRVDRRDQPPETFVTDDVRTWVEQIHGVRHDYLEGPRPESMRLFP